MGSEMCIRDSAVPNVYLIYVYPVNTDALVILHDRFASRIYPFRVRVSLRIGDIPDDIIENLFWSQKTPGSRIADVKLDDLLTLGFHFLRRFHDWSSDVIKTVIQSR